MIFLKENVFLKYGIYKSNLYNVITQSAFKTSHMTSLEADCGVGTSQVEWPYMVTHKDPPRSHRFT